MPTSKKKVAKKAPVSQYVTKKEFDEFTDELIAKVGEKLAAFAMPAPVNVVTIPQGIPATATGTVASGSTSPAETPLDKEIREAGQQEYEVNRKWDELARQIIGEALDHTELQYLKNGGVLFTIVVRNEFSNANQDYLDRHKVDRRSKEVGSEGIAGVEAWCKLVKSNLSRESNERVLSIGK